MMESTEKIDKRRSDLRIAAVLSSGTLIVAFLVYWYLQVQDVRELLRMAYG
jgi:hypothetical protein